MPERCKPYSVVSHDGWGSTSVGEFERLEEAQELFRALCVDRWFLTDGSVKGVSIVEKVCDSGTGLDVSTGGKTLESFAFSGGCGTGPLPAR